MNYAKIGDRLKVLLALLVLIPLGWLYLSIDHNTSSRYLLLILNIVPSLCAVLIGIPVLYLLYKIVGLEKLYNKREDQLLKKIETEVEFLRESFETKMSSLELITSFEEEFYNCDWKGLISTSNCHIDIVVYYFDSWINRYRNELIEYFKKPNTTMTIIVCNPDINNNLKQISRLYPDNESDLLKRKIFKTYDRLTSVANEAGASTSRIKFYLYPHLLNYSVQKFDNSHAVVSLFEMFRQSQVKAPTFELNLDKSAKLKSFFEKRD